MKQKINFILPTFAFIAIFITPTLYAEECEFVDSIANSQGALSIEGYSFVKGLNGGSIMRGNGCQGTITISTENSTTTTDVGDGVAKRSINIYAPGQDRKFATRFRVAPPRLGTAPNNLGLVFRDIEFTAPNADTSSPNGHLQFSLNSWDAGRTWTLSASLNYKINQQAYNIPLGNIYANALQNLEILMEYSQTYDSARRQWKPQIKLTYFRYNSAGAIFIDRTLVYAMPIGMEPVFQKHGLIGQDSMPEKIDFLIYNCRLNLCDYPLTISN